jgi:hypothetical protein
MTTIFWIERLVLYWMTRKWSFSKKLRRVNVQEQYLAIANTAHAGSMTPRSPLFQS